MPTAGIGRKKEQDILDRTRRKLDRGYRPVGFGEAGSGSETFDGRQVFTTVSTAATSQP
jgi:hypothetical protein